MADNKQIVRDDIEWVDAYIKMYCIIIHPDKNTEGKKPENVIRAKLLSANAALNNLIDKDAFVTKLEGMKQKGAP